MKRIVLFIAMLGIATIGFAGARYAYRLCHQEGYTCYKVKRGDTWEKLFPSENERDIVRRLNRMNTGLYAGLKIVVPDKLAEIDHMDIAPFPERIEPTGAKKVVVNLQEQAFGAYDEYGYLVHWGPVSGGKGWCSDLDAECKTPPGEYHFYHSRGANCISYKFPVGKGGAPMPYCMFFHRGYAMHASTLPGYNASHGCVRMFYEDAKWLNQSFVNVGKKGTVVVIQSM